MGTSELKTPGENTPEGGMATGEEMTPVQTPRRGNTPRGSKAIDQETTPKQKTPRKKTTPKRGKATEKEMTSIQTPRGENTPEGGKATDQETTQNQKTPRKKKTPKRGKATDQEMTPVQTPQLGNTPEGGKATDQEMTPKQKTPRMKNTPKGGKVTEKETTLKSLKFNKGSLNGNLKGNLKTPQPEKSEKAAGKKTPKSAPPAHIKRKKLEEEIDQQLSDDEFEKLLGNMKQTKDKKKAVTADSDNDDENNDDMSDFDLDDDDEDDDDENISDDDDDDDLDDSDDDDILDDESGDESDEEELAPAKKEVVSLTTETQKRKKQSVNSKMTKKKGAKVDTKNEDDNGDDDDEKEEEELAPTRKKVKKEVSPMRVAKKGRKQSLESKETTKQKGAKVATKDDDDCDDDTEGEESAPVKECLEKKFADEKHILQVFIPKMYECDSERTEVVINNLPLNTSVQDILDRCESGSVVELNFRFYAHRKNGLAFVAFNSRAAAETHLNVFNRMTLKGAKINAQFLKKKISQPTEPALRHPYQVPDGINADEIFFRNSKLYYTDEEKVKSLFPGASSVVIRGTPHGRYGSLFFPTESAATDALNEAKKQELEIDGERLEVTGTVRVILRSESRPKNESAATGALNEAKKEKPINGETLEVKETVKRNWQGQSKRGKAEREPTKLIVRPIPMCFNEDTLRSVFPGAYRAAIPKDNKWKVHANKNFKRYGIVMFPNAHTATRTLKRVRKQKMTLSGRVLEVERAFKIERNPNPAWKRSISEMNEDKTEEEPIAKKQKENVEESDEEGPVKKKEEDVRESDEEEPVAKKEEEDVEESDDDNDHSGE